MSDTSESLKVAAIQMSPVFLDKQATWNKLKQYLLEAIENGAELLTWGETLIPGYPQWVSATGGSEFNNDKQKQVYHKYWKEAVPLNDPIIDEMKELTKTHRVMFMGGILEQDGSSVYCTLITVKDGELLGRHRKIKPTYEERLVWADGDSSGLKVYDTKIGKIGGLNCWENWIPYTRIALHLQGEMYHIAIWPGSDHNTRDITRFIAKEGRSWVLSVSGMLRKEDLDHLDVTDFPVKTEMIEKLGNGYWNNGGSMIVSPRGKIIAGPLIDEEGILYGEFDAESVIKERHNFDISGHYSRKDIFNFSVNYPE